MKSFDIIVVGGGHAGLEATWIASQFNLQIGLLTLPSVPIGSAPCNPSVGGVGKGQVVRELDALGGLMGILADRAGIQYRTLNESKGSAVRSTRVQIDKDLYAKFAEEEIAAQPNVTIIRKKLVRVMRQNDDFQLITSDDEFTCQQLVMTVGTFLNGKLHTGLEQSSGGRSGVEAADSLGNIFGDIKTRPVRFKTGTPPRLHRASIQWDKLVEQPSEPSTRNFHCLHEPYKRLAPQVSCYLTHTNERTLTIIRDNREKSPMFNGQIQGVGARYCPSIEDKAFRYPERHSHHVFLEPEGLNLDTIYPSGISSSLPTEVQQAFVNSIDGLEEAEILVPGYAVEYDVVDTTQLKLSLEYKPIPGLYFAGQVNGTSGYEEAAGQGWVAGVNAALFLKGEAPMHLSRHESYIGVMIDDLVANTRDEPYRLFTARSEDRLALREDNSLLRMAPYRKKLNLSRPIDRHLTNFISTHQIFSELCDSLILPNHFLVPYFKKNAVAIPSQKLTLTEFLRQAWLSPVLGLFDVLSYFQMNIHPDVLAAVAISKKYEGYIQRSGEQFKRLQKLDERKIDWERIFNSSNVSFECRQRIFRIRPETFGQLKRIEGIRPATLAVVASGSF